MTTTSALKTVPGFDSDPRLFKDYVTSVAWWVCVPHNSFDIPSREHRTLCSLIDISSLQVSETEPTAIAVYCPFLSRWILLRTIVCTRQVCSANVSAHFHTF